MQRLYFLLFFLYALPCQAQEGCTDVQAINYDANALINDGSCEYPVTNVSPSTHSTLPAELHESSGLVTYDDQLIGINDSDSGPELIILDRESGEFLRKIVVTNAQNDDWESIAMDDTYLYIGDTGNNFGDRTNLGIYRVLLTDLAADNVTAEVMGYAYEDQVNFDYSVNETPYDCEAMIVDAEGIHLFTKGWNNGFTKHYKLNWTSGNVNATLVDSFEITGLVTGASINAEGILGFTGTDGAAFLWLFSDYLPGQFFSGNKRKIGLGFLGQNESLHFDKDQAILSSETTVLGAGKIFEVTYDDWFPSAVSNISITDISIYPNPFTESFILDWKEQRPGELSIIDSAGKLMAFSQQINYGKNLVTANLPSGIYVVIISSETGSFRTLMVKN